MESGPLLAFPQVLQAVIPLWCSLPWGGASWSTPAVQDVVHKDQLQAGLVALASVAAAKDAHTRAPGTWYPFHARPDPGEGKRGDGSGFVSQL